MKKKQKKDGKDEPDVDIASIKEALLHVYSPAQSSAQADEIVPTVDIFHTLAPICNFTKDALFIALKELGFKSMILEGTIYWLVNTQTYA